MWDRIEDFNKIIPQKNKKKNLQMAKAEKVTLLATTEMLFTIRQCNDLTYNRNKTLIQHDCDWLSPGPLLLGVLSNNSLFSALSLSTSISSSRRR